MLTWIRLRFRQRLGKHAPLSDLEQARQLIEAIDRGGIPLYPGRVNTIARNLGLEVSSRAPVEETIARIRAWLARSV
jgi:hypothetical protein